MYPDFVPQARELFDSPLVGDVVVFTREGWSFHPTHKSDHGGPLRQEMFVPLVVAGRGIGRGELPVVRQIDIVPTVLEFLGHQAPEGGLGGRSFLRSIKSVELVGPEQDE
jgi:arylsulfatase A-like enzyme